MVDSFRSLDAHGAPGLASIHGASGGPAGVASKIGAAGALVRKARRRVGAHAERSASGVSGSSTEGSSAKRFRTLITFAGSIRRAETGRTNPTRSARRGPIVSSGAQRSVTAGRAWKADGADQLPGQTPLAEGSAPQPTGRHKNH